MSVEFVFGSAGSGKSYYLRKMCRELADEKIERTCFFIVPDQYTYQAQKALCETSKSGVTINIEVLSFERFARRVFNELSTGLSDVLDDSGKALVLSRVITEKQNELSVLTKEALEKAGALDEVKSFISELRQYDITPKDIEDATEDKELSPAFKKKIKDIAILYEGFLSAIKGKYITSDEILTLLTKVLDRSKMAEKGDDSVFFFDGFTGFTPLQYSVIRKLLSYNERLIFSLTLSEDEDPYSDCTEENLFFLTKKTVIRLSEIAREENEEIIELKRLPDEPLERHRFKTGGELSQLNRFLFRPGKENESLSENGEIEIIRLNTPLDELSYACGKILEAVRNENLYFRDFAILLPKLDDYEPLVPGVFRKFNIPYNLDTGSQIKYDPFIIFLNAALDTVLYGFRYEDVMKCLRSGLCGIRDDERLDLFDSYLFSTGIQGEKKYEKLFTLLPDGFSAEDLIIINEVRERLIKSFLPFYKAMKKNDNDILSCCRALYELIASFDIETVLYEMADEAEKEDDIILSEEYQRIYPYVMDYLDRMCELLDKSTLSAEKFKEFLRLGLSEIDLFSLPFSSDCVTVGDLERTRVSDIKVLFLLGADDGAIPGNLSSGGVLSESEREELLSRNLELAPSGRQRAFIQRFYLYLALTKPSEKLYITSPSADMNGEGKKPSYLISEVEKLLSKNEGKSRKLSKVPFELFVSSRETLAEYTAGLISSVIDEENEGKGDEGRDEINLLSLIFPLLEKEDKDRALSFLETAKGIRKKEEISQGLMHTFHDGILKGSVTNLETYQSCPYSYFLRYELSLKEKRLSEINKADIGTFYHAVLRDYSREVVKQKGGFLGITDDESLKIFEKVWSDQIMVMNKAQDLELPYVRFMLKNMKHTLLRTISAMHFQLRRGSYVPKAFEKGLSDRKVKDILSDGTTLLLKGSIDRIDEFESERGIYLRVVDYKSSERKINLSDVYHGLELQLFTYLKSALEIYGAEGAEKGKSLLPGGILFSVIKDPVLEMKGEDVKKERLSSYRMDGILNLDEENLRACDSKAFAPAEDEYAGKSPVVPFSVNKDGTLSGRAAEKTMSGEDLLILSDLVKDIEKNAGEKIMKGEFPVSPYLKTYEKDRDGGMKTACRFCDYKAVCGFEEGSFGYEYRRIGEKTIEDLRTAAMNAGETKIG